jgi:hypothetical protein
MWKNVLALVATTLIGGPLHAADTITEKVMDIPTGRM